MFGLCLLNFAKKIDISFLKNQNISRQKKTIILFRNFILLIFAGFPPFFGFLKKVYLIERSSFHKILDLKVLEFEFF